MRFDASMRQAREGEEGVEEGPRASSTTFAVGTYAGVSPGQIHGDERNAVKVDGAISVTGV